MALLNLITIVVIISKNGKSLWYVTADGFLSAAEFLNEQNLKLLQTWF